MVAHLYKDLNPVLEKEKDRLERINGRQKERPRVNIPLVITASLLGVGVSSLLTLTRPINKKLLHNHPMCGTTTGGKVL